MTESHGSRPITREDRARAIWTEIIRSRSNVRFTPGMWRHLQQRRRRRWWRR